MLILWSTILAGAGCLLLATFILLRAQRTKGNLFFSLMLIMIGAVSIANYFSNNSKDSPALTLFWIRAVMFFVPPLMLALYEFAHSFQNRKYKFQLHYFFYLALATLAVMVLAVSPLTYRSVEIVSGKIVPQIGPAIILFGLFIFPLFIVSIYNMVKNGMAAADNKTRRNIFLTLILFLISFGTQMITSFILVAALNYTDLVPIGNFLMFLFALVITVIIFDLDLLSLSVLGPAAFVIALSLIAFAEVVTARGFQNILYKLVVFVVVCFIGYELIKLARREIEQRKELELISDELSKANQKLQAIDAMKTEFVSMASHELLTPISAIEGYLSMILDEKMVKVDDPKAKEYMDRVYKSAKRLARLVADLLNVSRIEEGRLLVEKQDVELEELITSVVNELKFKAEGAKIKLESEIGDGAKMKVYIDPDKIKEVVINLCGNSIKYNHENGFVKVKTTIMATDEVLKRVEAMAHVCKTQGNVDQPDDGSIQTAVNEKYKTIVGDKQIVVAVEDSGIGIEPCDIGHLFKKFSRVGDWSTQEVQGTGLGLYISRSLVEMHHGRIWVESAGKDKGSTFYFSLPVFETKDQVVKLDGEVPKANDAKPLAKSAVGEKE